MPLPFPSPKNVRVLSSNPKPGCEAPRLDPEMNGRRPRRVNQTGKPTILIADDDNDTRVMFKTLLAHKGYNVVEAGDGEEVIEAALRDQPGLVLLDLGLPLMNGLNAIRHLRNDLKIIDLPIVVITGYEKHFETAVAAGCDDYLLKPIDFERLESILDYYVPIKSATTSA